jgi:hypothetical protein
MKTLVLLLLNIGISSFFSSEIVSQESIVLSNLYEKNCTVSDVSVENIPQIPNINNTSIVTRTKILKKSKEEVQESSFYVDSIKGYFFNDSIAIQIFKYNEQGLVIEKIFLKDYLNEIDTTSRTKLEYDDSGNVLSESYELWSYGEWYGEYNKKYSYDKSNNLTEIHTEHLNEVIPKEEKQIYEWNNDNKLIHHSYYSRGMNPELKIRYAQSYTYDVFGNKIMYLYEFYDGTKTRRIYSYDVQGNLLIETEERWKDNVWNNKVKNINEYDGYNRLISSQKQEWSSDDWINTDKHHFSYDNNNNLISNIDQFWKDNDWLNNKKKNYIYENNLLVKDMIYEWSGTTWEITYENEYGFDSNSKQISTENYRWYESNKRLQNKRTFKYDDFQNLNLVLFEEGDVNNLNPKIDYIQFNDYMDRAFYSGGYKIEIFWNQLTTSVNNTYRDDFNLFCYPNPITNLLNLRYSLQTPQNVSIKIVNEQGIMLDNILNSVHQEANDYSIAVPVGNLSSGIYYCVMEYNKSKEIRKFIVIK